MQLMLALLLGFIIAFITFLILPSEKVRKRSISDIKTEESILGDLEGFVKFVVDMNRSLMGKKLEAFSMKYRKKLFSAGFDPAELNHEEFFILKELAALLFFLIGLLIFSSGTLIFSLIVAVLAFNLPDFILDRVIAKRKAEILRELPYVIDLLALAVEAGLDFHKAIQKIVDKSEPNVVIQELYTFLQEVKLGKTVDEALKYMSERIDVMAFFSFAEAIIRAQKFGGDIAKVLVVQSEQMRMVRFQMAEELAAKASIKLLIPLVVFVFPASLCVMIGPAIIKLLNEMTTTSIMK